MTGIRNFIFFTFFILVVGHLRAGDSLDVNKLRPGQLKKLAKGAILQGDFNSGAYYYEYYLKLRKEDFKSMYALAECYRILRDYKRAAGEYLKAYEKSNKEDQLSLFYYALLLKNDGAYEKSAENFQLFLKNAKGTIELRSYKKLALQELSGCDSAKRILSAPLNIAVIHLDTSINKINVEASPVAVSDSEIVYSSLRSDHTEYYDPTDTAHIPVRKFYTAVKEHDQWVFKSELDGPFNLPGYNTGNGSFSVDGKRFYFTRCKKNSRNKMICSIWVSEKRLGVWQEPEILDEAINNPQYTSTQPAVAIESIKQNEVIYYVSDRPDGRGGMDIWYTIYNAQKKTYRTPHNAGKAINTTGDEVTPFYDMNTRTLYFSSNGWPGLGGLDVFKAQGELNKWTPAENVGVPVNSSADDLYFTEGKNKEEGFFVSNRKGGNNIKSATCCDDIYNFKRLNYVHLSLSGTIYEMDSTSKQLLPDAVVSLYQMDKNQNLIFISSVRSNASGHYEMGLEPVSDYKLVISKEGYFNKDLSFSTRPYTKSQVLLKDAELAAVPKGAIVLKNIYYSTDKADLNADALATLDTTLYPILIQNPDLIVEISSHTDYRGSDSYNQALSQRRAESVVKYLLSKGIPKERLSAVGYGESRPLAPNKNADGSDNIPGMDKNRRTEFRIIGRIPHTKIEYKD